MKNVLVVGVFDLFHKGHLELLRKASECGDRMFVIINGDHMVEKYKRRPIFNENDRLDIVSALSIVDKAVISNEFDVKPYIESFDINVIVHGDDWPHEKYLEQIRCSPEYIANKKIDMVYLPYYQGVSTSGLIKQIKEGIK